MKNKNLVIVGIVMLVNALSYGTIIPLMYLYTSTFGMTATAMSFLFAAYSLAQFIATPIIGRLSDRYGRKPLLLLSLFGTSVSLYLFSAAGSIAMLFFARILDGITGGNISVAQAVIADTTKEKERAKAYGMLGAIFGVGFVAGPALGGLLSKNNLSTPFVFASIIALFATALGVIFLDETNKHKGEGLKNQPLFNVRGLKDALFSPLTGAVLAVSFIALTAGNAMIIGFQSFTVDVLSLDAGQIGIIFAAFGIVSVIMQGFGIRVILKKIESKRKILKSSLILSGIMMFGIFTISSHLPFVVLLILYGAAISPLNPVIVGMLSERTKAEDQGGILGINQSLTSLTQIVGPLLAGVLVVKSANLAFLATSLILFLALIPAGRIIEKKSVKLDL